MQTEQATFAATESGKDSGDDTYIGAQNAMSSANDFEQALLIINGVNDYVFLQNQPVSNVEFLGLAPYDRCVFLRSKCSGYKNVRLNLLTTLGVCIRRNCFWRCYCDENVNCPDIPCKNRMYPKDHGVEERMLAKSASGAYGGVTPADCKSALNAVKNRGNCSGKK